MIAIRTIFISLYGLFVTSQESIYSRHVTRSNFNDQYNCHKEQYLILSDELPRIVYIHVANRIHNSQDFLILVVLYFRTNSMIPGIQQNMYLQINTVQVLTNTVQCFFPPIHLSFSFSLMDTKCLSFLFSKRE